MPGGGKSSLRTLRGRPAAATGDRGEKDWNSESIPGDGRLGWILAFAVLGCCLVVLVVAVKIAGMARQFDYEEGNILNAGLRILHGQTPYPEPHSWPIVFNPYGPIPYLVTAGLIKLFGVTFLAPRLISIVCGLLITLMIAALINRFAKSIPASIVFAGAFLAIANIRIWLVVCRVYWLALALSLAGLVVFVFWEKRWYWVAFLFAAALFVKYSMQAAPSACAICLIQRRDWKVLGKLAVSGAAWCLVGFLVSQWWYGGNFAFHQFQTHADNYSIM